MMTDAHGHVEPFGFDRVFQNAAPSRPGDRENGHDAEALLAHIQALQQDHRDELARARSDAFQAGLDQARREAQVALLAAVDALHAAVDDLDARFAAAVAQQTRAAADVAWAAAEVLAGHAIDGAPQRAIGEALDRVLDQVARGTRLCVHINPEQHDALAALLAERQRNDRRQLDLTTLADPAIVPGDAVIVWDEGGLAVDAAARRAAVLAELGPALQIETP